MATCAARSTLVATPRVMLPLCALVFSDGPKVCPRRSQRRSDPEQDGGGGRQRRRECQDPQIEARIHDEGVGFWEPQHELFPPPGEDGAADPAEDSQEETFGQQLPNDPPPARAECQSHRHLLAARGRTDQEQVREIETPDQTIRATTANTTDRISCASRRGPSGP